MWKFDKSGNAIVVTRPDGVQFILNQKVDIYNYGNQIVIDRPGAEDITLALSDIQSINGVSGFTSLTDAFTAFKGFFLDAGSNAGILPLNSRIVYFGDSITAHGFGGSAGNYAWQNYGFTTFAALYSNNAFFMPVGGNLGVSGDTTTLMINRLGAVLALNPDVVTVMGGTNDITNNITAAAIISNLQIIYNSILSKGKIVVAHTILQRFAPAALTTAQEIVRQTVNTAIRAKVGNKFRVVDGEQAITSAGSLIDGLHPNSIGAQAEGALSGAQLSYLIAGDISDLLTKDNSYTTNLYFQAGSTLATGWNLTNNSGGLTATASLVVESDGTKSQQLVLSGNYTGSSREIDLYQTNFTTYLPAVGNLIEAIGKYQIIANDPNIVGINVYANVFDASVANLAVSSGLYFQDQLSNQLPITRSFVSRGPAVAVGAGTPASVRLTVAIKLKDQVSSTPVNATIKIFRVGMRIAS